GVHAADVDDDAAALLQGRKRGLDEQEWRAQVQVELAVELLGREVADGRAARVRGAVDQDVDPPERLERPLDEALAVLDPGEVALFLDPGRPPLPDERLAVRPRAAAQHDPPP